VREKGEVKREKRRERKEKEKEKRRREMFVNNLLVNC
jgi:hypothetical protein